MATSQQSVQFSSLPLELRQKIWIETFSPRILELHVHEDFKFVEGPMTKSNAFISPPNSDMLRERQLVSVRFTATVLSESLTAERKSHESTPGHKPCREIGPPPAPVALFVCRESRELALKRYNLSFGGTAHWESPKPCHRDEGQEEWSRGLYSSKRIWVDFERDTVVLACITANENFWYNIGSIGGMAMHLLAKYAESESRMMRRFVLKGFWIDSATRQGLCHFQLWTRNDGMAVPSVLWSLLNSWIWRFKTLRELVIYDTWQPMVGPRLPVRKSWGVSEARDYTVRTLSDARSRMEEWTAELPLITIVQDINGL